MTARPPQTKKYEQLLDLGHGLVIAKVDIDDLIEQDQNARVMRQDAFNQLTSNIKNAGALESLPFCALTPKGIEIVSGHHRVRSVRIVANTLPELRHIFILLDVNGLTKNEIRAKQLAHNSIQGFDDPTMLLRIYQSIDDANLRIQAFIDEKKLTELEHPQPLQLTSSPCEFSFKTLRIFLLPKQVTDIDKAVDMLIGDEDKIFLATIEGHEKLLEAMSKIMNEEDIRSVGFSFARMAELALERLDQISFGKDVDKLCATCKPDVKKHCLTPGDPSPVCVMNLRLKRTATKGDNNVKS
jgi:hypothetical protein